MNKTAFIAQLKACIGEGQVEKAVDLLGENMHFFDPSRHNDITLLRGRYNQAEEDFEIKNIIEHADFMRVVAQITAGILEILEDLEKPLTETGAPTGQRGQLLHTIPSVMPLMKEMRCIVRIAFDLETLIYDVLVTPDTTITEVRIAEVMAVELIDFNETPAFFIRTATEEEQFLEASDYTQWLFMVKAVREGRFPLTLKVSVIEEIKGKERRRDIVLEKEVFIVNHEATTAPPLRFEVTPVQLEAAARPGFAAGDIPESVAPEPIDAPSAPAPAPPSVPMRSTAAKPPQRPLLRPLVAALALLIVGIGGYVSQMNFGSAASEPSGDLGGTAHKGNFPVEKPENKQDTAAPPKSKLPKVKNEVKMAETEFKKKPEKKQPITPPKVYAPQAVPLPPQNPADLSGEVPDDSVYLALEQPAPNTSVSASDPKRIISINESEGVLRGIYVVKSAAPLRLYFEQFTPSPIDPKGSADTSGVIFNPKIKGTQYSIELKETLKNGHIKLPF